MATFYAAVWLPCNMNMSHVVINLSPQHKLPIQREENIREEEAGMPEGLDPNPLVLLGFQSQ